MVLDLRPLTLAELLDRSFATYRRHLWLFVGIMAGPAALGLVYGLVFQAFQFATGGPPRATSADEILRRAVPMVVAALTFMAVYLVAYAFAVGATTIAVAHIYRNQAITVGGTYAEVRRHGWRLILLLVWAWLRVALAVGGAAFLCAILATITAVISPILSVLVMLPAIAAVIFLAFYLIVRYGVSVPAVVLENLTAHKALGRSVQLTEGHRGRVFLVLMCAAVVTYAVGALLQGPFIMGAFIAGPGTGTALILTMIGTVLGTIGSMFSGPIMIIGIAMIYYDLRIRKEALDLQVMLESLDASRG